MFLFLGDTSGLTWLPLSHAGDVISQPSVPSREPPWKVQTAHGSDQQYWVQGPLELTGAWSVFLEWQELPQLTAAKEHSVQYEEFLETRGNFILEQDFLESLRMYLSIS